MVSGPAALGGVFSVQLESEVYLASKTEQKNIVICLKSAWIADPLEIRCYGKAFKYRVTVVCLNVFLV